MDTSEYIYFGIERVQISMTKKVMEDEKDSQIALKENDTTPRILSPIK